jgi:hypothetical protein
MLSLFADSTPIVLPSLDLSHLILSLLAAAAAWFTHGKVNPTITVDPALAGALQTLLNTAINALVKSAANQPPPPAAK